MAHLLGKAFALRRRISEDFRSFLNFEELALWPEQSLLNAPTLADVTSYLSRGRQSLQGDSAHHLIKTQHVQMGNLLPTDLKLAPSAAAKVASEALVNRGDVLIACSAAGCLGRVAVYDGSGLVASTDTHVAIARANPSIVLPEYLYAYLRGAQGQKQLRSRERGDWAREKVGFRLIELNVSDMRRVPVPVPAIEKQRLIVEYIASLYRKLDTVKELQNEMSEEVDALLPAVAAQAG